MTPVPKDEFSWWLTVAIFGGVLTLAISIAASLLRSWMRRVEETLKEIHKRLDSLFERFLTREEWEAWRKGIRNGKLDQ